MIRSLIGNREADLWYETDMPDECPPADAFGANGTFYRFVSGKPSEEDFIPHSRLYPDRSFSGMECQARALSVFSSIEDCMKLRKLSPKFRNKSVAAVQISPADGVIKHTPSGQSNAHYSWWRAASCLTINYTVLSNE